MGGLRMLLPEAVSACQRLDRAAQGRDEPRSAPDRFGRSGGVGTKVMLVLGRGWLPLQGPGAASWEQSCPVPGSGTCLLLAPWALGVAALGRVTCVRDASLSQGCAEHPQEEIRAWLQRAQGSGPTPGGLAGVCWAIGDCRGLGRVCQQPSSRARAGRQEVKL